MKPYRLEALTDGVVAIILTIMVLELKVPEGGSLSALAASLPTLLTYAVTFMTVALWWNNHHHMLQIADRIDGRVLWANIGFLFWLSLMPFVIRWLDASAFSPGATAAYGFVLGMAAVAYQLTEHAIMGCEGKDSAIARAIGKNVKGKISLLFYAVAVPVAFISRAAAIALLLAVILLWLLPDRRIEKVLRSDGPKAGHEA